MERTEKLYVIGNAGVPTVKIGISIDPERRVAELIHSWHPYRIDPKALVLLRVYEHPHAHSLEQWLHSQFSTIRIRRFSDPGVTSSGRSGTTEWFRFRAGALFMIDGAVSQFSQGERI